MDRNKQYEKMVTAFGNMDYNGALGRLLEVAVLEMNSGYFGFAAEDKWFIKVYPDGAIPQPINLNVMRYLRDIIKLKDMSVSELKELFLKTENKLSKKEKHKINSEAAWDHLMASLENINLEAR
jgi:hypothetical protein